MKKYIFCFALVSSVLAQDTVELPKLVISSATGEVRLDFPVFADQASYIDTPRSYSTIDSLELAQSNITKIGQFQSFDASAQTIGTYGHTATINIRGDMAELYQNGQRRTNNAAGFQPSLNGVERVDLIKGAAPVVFGPGFYSGGYVNMSTKTADNPQSNYSIGIGTLSADHNYPTINVSADKTIRLNEKTAFRFSYEGQEDETFYKARNDKQDIYLTLRRQIDDAILDIFAQHIWQASPQIEGINNPNQTLIDTGINPTYNLYSPGDFSNANITTLQAIYNNSGFRSYSLAEYVNRRRFNAFAYLEWATQLTFDQRLEWHKETDNNYIIGGLHGRYEYRESYTNYFNAFFDAYDISQPGIRDARLNPNYIEGFEGPDGYLFFGPLDGNSDTTLSNLYQFAPFFQHRLKISNFQFLYGGRIDSFRAFVTDPLTRSVSDNVTSHSFSRMASIILGNEFLSIYATYANLYSINGTVSGGGIVLAPDMKINTDNLKSLNRLYEVGLRYDGSCKIGLTIFSQERQQPDLYAYKPNDIVINGVELEVSKTFGSLHLRSSFAYNDGKYDNSLPFEFAPTVSEPGNYNIPGLSKFYATINGSYYYNNWAFGLNGRFQSKQTGNLLETYEIPEQYTIDGFISYGNRDWRVSVNIGNITNNFNWLHNGDTFGDNAVIHHESLRNISITFSLFK